MQQIFWVSSQKGAGKGKEPCSQTAGSVALHGGCFEHL